MFKKLKDKLAEEVKSSPQRIHQFAQAAQAAVTSASSSISDITNSDLFSIGDNDTQQQPRSSKTQSSLSQQNTFQDVSLVQPLQSPSESQEYGLPHDIPERQRRLSNSSFASDVSFRLPSYETPSMYHLQSDMEVSASEAEERAFSGGAVGLDRVTKEQLYAAYRRTQERYTKYRTQYGDLARHYKLLERENAKARSVLVETQDKALRRISELREQCCLEQSAKAHLEKALRIEIEEKNMKIDTLNTKVQFLQNSSDFSNNGNNENKHKSSEGDGDVQLINLSNDSEVKQTSDDSAAEILSLNNKVEKMEQLLNKYKDSLKTSKEKNSQINTELQMLSNELETKNKGIENLKLTADHLTKAEEKIKELYNLNEELQNKINVFEFNKTREKSTLEVDYQKAQEEIAELRGKMETYSKKEEEYAISLAENKLSIHKELESKEAEIRSLKDGLDISKKEIQSLNIVVNDYKKNLSLLETERSKLMHDTAELTSNKSKIADLESRIDELSKKCQSLEQSKTKADEGYKCLQLQLKQETAEKLAMIDRNGYLENRNTQLSEENTKKSTQIGNLENELQKRDKIIKELAVEESKTDELLEELSVWKDRYAKLESEIQEERDELIKLQTEIETLLANHESSEKQNIEFRNIVYDLKTENAALNTKVIKSTKLKSFFLQIASEIKNLKNLTMIISNDAKSLKIINNQAFVSLVEQINYSLNNVAHSETSISSNKQNELNVENTTLKQELNSYVKKYETLFEDLNSLKDENNNLKATISELGSKKSMTDEQFEDITNKYEIAINELNSENEKLSHKMSEIEKNCQVAIEFEKNQYSESVKNINTLENEKQSLKEKVSQLENVLENEILNFEEKLANVETSLQNEKQSLMEQITKLENALVNERQSLAQNASIVENRLKNEKQCLTEKVSKLEIELENEKQILAEKVSNLEIALQNEKQSSVEKISKLENALENEKQSSVENVSKLENELKKDNQGLLEKISELENALENEKQSSMEKVSKLESALHNDKQSSVEKVTKLENALANEKQVLLETVSKLENELKNEKQSSLKKVSKLENALENEKQSSVEKLSKLEKELENEKQSSVEKVTKLENALANEKQALLETVSKLENALENEKQSSVKKLSKLKKELENEKQSSVEKLSKLEKELKNEKHNAVEKVSKIENEKHLINVELDTVKVQQKKDVEELNIIKRQNTSLLEESQRLEDKVSSVTTLQEDNKKLTLENISLKSQVESIAGNYNKLETEINDVRKSHAEIETEKDRLNEIIEKLESRTTTTVNQDIQTDGKQQMESKDTQIGDSEVFNKKLIDLQESKLPQNLDANNDELSSQYLLLKTEYDTIKDENRRFKSDIEGLQSYLTKISKENSVLNDKLRELIATSEHTSDNHDVSTDLLDLKKEVQSNKERIDDLLRENSLLIEENLELKDQLQTQNYPQSESKSSNDNERETSIYKEKYSNVMQVNSTLEKRVVDLEQMHKSVHGNMSQMQDKNEKLRLSNEKLERRLDEALVSLRHLHSLQENTELEYLRNILYEYLTGSGMHSVTLAKVLSAIVKFDDMQTKLVLQKEKERQGFLRQLGII